MKVRQGAATYSRVNFLSRTPQPRSGATVWSCHYRCAFAKVEFNVDSRPFTKKHETPECNSPGQADEQQTTAPFHEDEAKRRVQVQPRAVRTDSSPTFHEEDNSPPQSYSLDSTTSRDRCETLIVDGTFTPLRPSLRDGRSAATFARFDDRSCP